MIVWCIIFTCLDSVKAGLHFQSFCSPIKALNARARSALALLSSTWEVLVADQHEIENICAPKTTTNMAPFSRRKLLLLIILRRRCEQRRNKRKARFLVRQIFRERKEKGENHTLVKETMLFDQEYFSRMFRMTPRKFEALLKLVGPKITLDHSTYHTPGLVHIIIFMFIKSLLIFFHFIFIKRRHFKSWTRVNKEIWLANTITISGDQSVH